MSWKMPNPHQIPYLTSIGIIAFFVLLVLVFWTGYSVSWRNGLHKLRFTNQQQLEQFIDHLDSQLSRYGFIPQLVAITPC
jgi:C4-dicarboxylate-specific signal transduction histidine kinase